MKLAIMLIEVALSLKKYFMKLAIMLIVKEPVLSSNN